LKVQGGDKDVDTEPVERAVGEGCWVRAISVQPSEAVHQIGAGRAGQQSARSKGYIARAGCGNLFTDGTTVRIDIETEEISATKTRYIGFQGGIPGSPWT
jgi:hypothetical protein